MNATMAVVTKDRPQLIRMCLDFSSCLGLVNVQENVHFPGIFASGRSSKFHGLSRRSAAETGIAQRS